MKKYKGQIHDLTGNVNENDILVEFAKKLKEPKTKMKGLEAFNKLAIKYTIGTNEQETLENMELFNNVYKELKALEIIKKHFNKIHSFSFYKKIGMKITKEQYDLLKEVLNNE